MAEIYIDVLKGDLLLYLVVTISTCEADNKLQLFCSIVHKLAFQRAFFCFCGPG